MASFRLLKHKKRQRLAAIMLKRLSAKRTIRMTKMLGAPRENQLQALKNISTQKAPCLRARSPWVAQSANSKSWIDSERRRSIKLTRKKLCL